MLLDPALDPAVHLPTGDERDRLRVLRARALNAAGFRATDQAEYELAAASHREPLGIWRDIEDTAGLVTSLHGVGDTALWMGDLPTARSTDVEGLALATARGSGEDVALFAFHLGQLSWLAGDLDDAEARAMAERTQILGVVLPAASAVRPRSTAKTCAIGTSTPNAARLR